MRFDMRDEVAEAQHVDSLVHLGFLQGPDKLAKRCVFERHVLTQEAGALRKSRSNTV